MMVNPTDGARGQGTNQYVCVRFSKWEIKLGQDFLLTSDPTGMFHCVAHCVPSRSNVQHLPCIPLSWLQSLPSRIYQITLGFHDLDSWKSDHCFIEWLLLGVCLLCADELEWIKVLAAGMSEGCGIFEDHILGLGPGWE